METNDPLICYFVDIEVTNSCNAACFSCPRAKMQVPTRGIGFMEEDLFVTLMNRYHDVGVSPFLNFCGMGEPLLNERLPDFIAITKRDPFWFRPDRIVTNGSLLTRDKSLRLLQAGIDVITFSFPSTEPREYRDITGGLELDKLIENITIARELFDARVLLTANVVRESFSESNRRIATTFLENLGLSVIHFTKLHNRGGHLKSIYPESPPRSIESCHVFSEINFIDWRGRVLSCCHDLAGENVIGDLRTDSLASIARKKRELLRQPLPFAICRKCNDENRLVSNLPEED